MKAKALFALFFLMVLYLTGIVTQQSDAILAQSGSGITMRISVATDGTQGNNVSYEPSFSADGRFVSFNSFASNLVVGDTNGLDDVFVHDRQTGQTTRVSVASDGTQGNFGSYNPSISADSRFVVFSSFTSNLVMGDTNGSYDVFVHDRQTGQTTRVSVATDGTQGNDPSGDSTISADGRFIAFTSNADNLVVGDTNGFLDVFVHEMEGTIVPTPVPTPSPTPSPTPTPETALIYYFALGDSFASGHGLMDDGSPCHRSERAYPYIVTDLLRTRYGNVQPIYFACSGATAGKPDRETLQQDQHKWLRRQVDHVLPLIPPDQPVLVSISIGANDFHWADEGNFFWRLYVPGERSFNRWVRQTSSSVRTNLRRELNRLLKKPNVAIVVTQVYDPFNDHGDSVFFAGWPGTTCGIVDCHSRVNYGIETLNLDLLLATLQASDPDRVRITSSLHDDFRGHESPQPWCNTNYGNPDVPDTSETWIQYITDPESNSILPVDAIYTYVGIVNPDLKRGDCFHPNRKGANAFAEAVNEAALVLDR